MTCIFLAYLTKTTQTNQGTSQEGHCGQRETPQLKGYFGPHCIRGAGVVKQLGIGWPGKG